ncbi:MAG: mechanosensitive ion channel family protein [Perlucidibaca sp.]
MILDLETIWLDNTLEAWGTALALALSINALVALMKWLVIRHAGKTAQLRRRDARGGLDHALVAMARHTKQPLIFLVTLMIGTQYLELKPGLEQGLSRVATIAGFLQLGLWLGGGLNFWIDRYRVNSHDAGATTSLAALNFIGKLLMWALITMAMLDNLGVNVTAMVAGLGVGGIAVALAVQNILGDLFASLSIVIDKPFVIGETIMVDNFMGTVEHVGLKTTRLRSTTGEQIIISNSDLLKTRIRNYKRMHERRASFVFGVVYQTTADQLAAIPGIVRGIVESVPGTRFERAHFKTFGASSLDYEVVYWMLDPDFIGSLDAQQAINLALFKRFGDLGIEFAYPTQTLIVQGQGDKLTGSEG